MYSEMHYTGHEAGQLFIALASPYVQLRFDGSQQEPSRACEQCDMRTAASNSESLEIPKLSAKPNPRLRLAGNLPSRSIDQPMQNEV